MKRAILIKGLLSVLLLLMAACAPRTQLIDGGRTTLKYHATPESILKLIKDARGTLDLPEGYGHLNLTELSSGVIQLSAKPLVATTVKQKQEILITFTAEQRYNYTHLIIKTSSGTKAESVKNQIVKLLDTVYARYQEGLLPKKQLLTQI